MAATTSEMEVDTSPSGVMASTVTSGSVSVSLHPLVVMNISEHWTRVRAQGGGNCQQVIGALIGKQKGRNIEVMNSFELLFDKVDNDIVIDTEYYQLKEEQFKQVFSDMDFLGWYTTGEEPSPADIVVHKQILVTNFISVLKKIYIWKETDSMDHDMGLKFAVEICQINESPILLKLNPLSRKTDLPVSVFESVIDLVNGEATMLFVELHYTLATEEAERIGVDHVARMSSTDMTTNSSVAEHLIAQHNSVKMLYSRVKIILQYIEAVNAGELPKEHDILREAYSMCHRLPVLDSNRFKEDFFNQCNDVSLMAYLGTITKSCSSINQFINKFNVLYGREGVGRRVRGFLFTSASQ